MADGTGLSLKPFPVSDKKPSNVADFIARVNAQPGGFRALSAARLRDEASRQGQGQGTAPDDDVDMMSSGSGSSSDDDDDNDAADPQQARLEVLRNVDMAAHTAMLTLDSVSLLLSKQNPTQASLTLSKQLREVVGIGSLGADLLEEPAADEAKAKDHEAVALGWTLMEVNKTRDSARAACDLLAAEMRSETKYWDDIMGVQAKGWSICKTPQDKHTLGVRVGFSEATPEFKAMGLVPMRRDTDGSANLDSGLQRLLSQRLVITCQRNGATIGRCALDPGFDSDDAPLEARVLQARNRLFDEELWHELGREARALAAYDVGLSSTELTYDMDADTRITVRFTSPDAAGATSLPEDATAENVSLVLHVLLSYAHRHNELVRKRPLPPHFPRSRGQVPYTLLRPVIAYTTLSRNVDAAVSFVGHLTGTLRKAGVDSSFVLRTARPDHPSSTAAASRPPGPGPGPGGPPPGPGQQLPASQLFVRNVLQPADFHIALHLVPGVSLTIRGRTHLYPVTATYYHVVPPAAPALDAACPPHRDGYPSVRALADYLCAAATRLLADRALERLVASPSPGAASGAGWTRNVQGTAIRRADNDNWQCLVHVAPDPDAPKPDEHDDTTVAPPILTARCHNIADGKASGRTVRWAGHRDDGADTPLDQVVGEMAQLATR